MFKKITLLATLCTLGLVACGPGTSSDPQVDTITLKLSQMEDGDLQFCDEATGECHDLPYDGECVIVEVDIDPNTGGTCERCITADGEVIDMGCSNTSVGCVLVTLPEPDCVVCAYVNGAIIFSSCVADDEPECRTDADCLNSAGQRGFCFEGQCVYEEGCTNDGDCPAGFQCVFPTTVDPDGTTNSDTGFVGAGTCVPQDIRCLSDAECPSDMMCEVWCWDNGFDPSNCADPDGTNCMPPEQCEGVCVDRPYDPCATVLCPNGHHCEVACWADGNDPTEPGVPGDVPPRPCHEDDPNCGGGGGCEPVCVPDPTRCSSNDDCGENEICEMWCYEPQPGDPTDPSMECDPSAGEECAPMPCEGVCVPHIQDPCEIIDLDCGQGRHCEVMCYDAFVPCFDNDPFCGCEAVCVDDPSFCTSDAECDDGEMCEMWCYDMPIDCTDPAGVDCMPAPCNGVCVPAVAYCYADADCPEGQVCEFYDTMPPQCDPASGNCDGLWAPAGVCVDNGNLECVSDADCADGDVWNARCVNGRCEYVEQFCLADSDCPAGHACAENPTGIEMGICVPVNTDDCFRTGCSGEICADEHMDSTCQWLPEYACFDRATCERQDNGACGWTFTEDFEICLQSP